MSEFIFVVLGGAACFAMLAIWATWRADEAVAAGELRYWARRLPWSEQVIRRVDNPRRFEIEIKMLRSVPWITAVLTAFALLLMGLLL